MFSSGLQELGRARIFGSRTAGASLPAQFVGLVNGDTLIYPTSTHLTESGEMIEGVGVRPDVEVTPTREELLKGGDPVLDSALAWIAEAGEPVAAGLARNNEPIKEATRP
jgi:carboxyl-terminal processing protease